MPQENYTIVTNYGREWNARAAAGEAVSPIAEMVFGDGDRAPVGGEVALLNEVHRSAIGNQGLLDDATAAFFEAYLPAEIGGFVIREHGLLTADGRLVAVGVRNPGIPKADPATGAADDFTYRIDVFFDQLDALVVEIDPVHGVTRDSLECLLFTHHALNRAYTSQITLYHQTLDNSLRSRTALGRSLNGMEVLI